MIILIILTNALSAVGFPTTKILLQHFTPFFLSGIRLVACAALLFGYHFITARSWPVYKKSDLWMFFKLSFFSFFISFGFGLWALEYVSAAKVSFLYNSVPFFSALFSYFYFAEKMTLKKLLGLSIGFLGFVPLLLANGTSGKHGALIEWSDLLLLITVLTYVYGLIITRKIMLSGAYTPTIINATGMLLGGIFSLLAFPFIESHPVKACTGYDLLMFFLAVVSVVLSYNLTAYLLKKYTTTFLSFLAFIMPFFVAAYSWFLLGERITWHFFVSSATVLLGLYIFYQEELRQGYIK